MKKNMSENILINRKKENDLNQSNENSENDSFAVSTEDDVSKSIISELEMFSSEQPKNIQDVNKKFFFNYSRLNKFLIKFTLEK